MSTPVRFIIVTSLILANLWAYAHITAQVVALF